MKNNFKEDIVCTIRIATVDDIKSISFILSNAFAEYKAFYTKEAYLVATPSIEQILSRWSEGPVWVGLVNDRIMGTIAGVPNKMSLYIRSLSILPEARGCGLGILLLNELEKYSRMHGYKRLYLSTTDFLKPAIRLYEQCGFIQLNGEEPQELQGMPLFTMEKLLL
ncbi:MAG: GNAT family N-acetyltransferase [Pseudomonadota bacterium]